MFSECNATSLGWSIAGITRHKKKEIRTKTKIRNIVVIVQVKNSLAFPLTFSVAADESGDEQDKRRCHLRA